MPTDAERFGRDIALPDDPEDELQVTASGDLLLREGRPNARAALRRRLICSPGALIHRPDYGAGVLDYLELPNSLSTRTQLGNAVRRNLLADDRVGEVVVNTSAGLADGTARPQAITVELSVTWRAEEQASDQLTLDLSE